MASYRIKWTLDTDAGDEEYSQEVINATAIIQGYTGSTYQSPRLDASTYALESIDYAHHEIHSGSSYTVSDTVLCDDTTCKWQITTPNTTKYSHMFFDLSCTGEATFLTTEGSDRTDGTALAEMNRHRVGTPGVAGTIVTRTPTGGATDGATTLFSVRNGTAARGGRSANTGSARDTNEWVLKPNTKYVVSVTTYDTDYVTFLVNWYEHVSKEV